MREIKFRLILHKKIIGYEKWYGGLFSEISGQTANACWLYSRDNKYWKPDFLWHEEKNQYTGLKDKNGKEIYEGDIVTGIGFKDKTVLATRHTVEWLRGGYMFRSSYGKTEVQRFWLDWDKVLLENIEVIGNIHENPKMLKEENIEQRDKERRC